MENIRKALELVHTAKSLVILTGAGASHESGIPDSGHPVVFINKPKRYDYPAEVLLSHSFFVEHTDIFYEYISSVTFI